MAIAYYMAPDTHPFEDIYFLKIELSKQTDYQHQHPSTYFQKCRITTSLTTSTWSVQLLMPRHVMEAVEAAHAWGHGHQNGIYGWKGPPLEFYGNDAKNIFLLHQTLDFFPIQGRVPQSNFHKVIDG